MLEHNLGLKVSKFQVSGLGFQVLGFKFQCFRFLVSSFGFQVPGFKFQGFKIHPLFFRHFVATQLHVCGQTVGYLNVEAVAHAYGDWESLKGLWHYALI